MALPVACRVPARRLLSVCSFQFVDRLRAINVLSRLVVHFCVGRDRGEKAKATARVTSAVRALFLSLVLSSKEGHGVRNRRTSISQHKLEPESNKVDPELLPLLVCAASVAHDECDDYYSAQALRGHPEAAHETVRRKGQLERAAVVAAAAVVQPPMKPAMQPKVVPLPMTANPGF